MRLMACILVVMAATQFDSCLPPEVLAPAPRPAILAAGNLNNLVLVEVTGPAEFRFWRRDAHGTWRDGGKGLGDVAAVAARREDLLLLFDTGRYAVFSLTATEVYPSPVPAWTPVAACEDGQAVEAFGWNASGEPILARYEGGKWAWQRVEADLSRDLAKDVCLVHFAGRPYVVWREESEPILEKSSPAVCHVRFVYKEGGRWHPVTSRLLVTSAPLVASDGQHLVFLYQKPAESPSRPAAWTLASYLTSDEDWHETAPVTGAVPEGPIALARQGSQFFVAILVDEEPQVAALDPATGRLEAFAPPAVEKTPVPGELSPASLALMLAMTLLAAVLLGLSWRRTRAAAGPQPASQALNATAGTLLPAPVWRRIIACGIDYMIIGTVCIAALAVLSPDFSLRLQAQSHLARQPLAQQDLFRLTLLMLVRFPYFMACEAAFGCTLGKRLLGLMVVDENGGRPRLGQIVTRNLLRLVDELPGALYVVGLVLVLVGPRRQRLGDRLARTLVVRGVPGHAPAGPQSPPRP